MPVRRFFLTLIVLASISAAHAEQKPEALRIESDQAFYNKNGLALWVVLVDDPDAFFREWLRPTSPGAPHIKTRTSFKRGDIVFPVIMYQTDGLKPDGKADIKYSFVFKRPDGSIYEDMKDKTVVDGTPPKGVGIFKDMMGLKIEDNDPYGAYTLEVTVNDRVKNVSVQMPFLFTVTDPEAERKSLLDTALPGDSPKPASAAATPGSSPAASPTESPVQVDNVGRLRSRTGNLR